MSIRLQQQLLLRPLSTPDDLHRWVRLFCNLNIPRTPACAGSNAPFVYLVRAYFEPASDQVVHACRGGGKTRLAAVATLLDLLHKPGIAVRILGGSLEQSTRMWEHLLPDLNHAARELLKRRVGNARRVELKSGSTCAVLTQSERCVRGLRVQKLRCDEVEVFSPEVWSAAQLVTKSRRGSVEEIGASKATGRATGRGSASTGTSPPPAPRAPLIHGAVDALSTLHKPFGLMQHVIEQAESVGTPVVRWNLVDVLAPCPPTRECGSCPLLAECGGVAKTRRDGFVSIDDAIRMKKRVSLETWKNEMLCERPTFSDAVFASFDPEVHVRQEVRMESAELSLAIDFGIDAPFVCLWIRTQGEVSYVVDEYVQEGRRLAEHVEAIRQRPWPVPAYIACDPAGAARSDQTGLSNVQHLRRAGFEVRHRRSMVEEGVERVRAALRPASGEPTLFIHPRCRVLIRSLTCLRLGRLKLAHAPIKDGVNDHAADALRYHFVNRVAREAGMRVY